MQGPARPRSAPSLSLLAPSEFRKVPPDHAPTMLQGLPYPVSLRRLPQWDSWIRVPARPWKSLDPDLCVSIHLLATHYLTRWNQFLWSYGSVSTCGGFCWSLSWIFPIIVCIRISVGENLQRDTDNALIWNSVFSALGVSTSFFDMRRHLEKWKYIRPRICCLLRVCVHHLWFDNAVPIKIWAIRLIAVKFAYRSLQLLSSAM